jgi:hypothetical protein
LFRVARRFIFVPKIPIWEYLGGPWNGQFGIFYGHLEYFAGIWYTLWQFGIPSLWSFGIVCGHLA